MLFTSYLSHYEKLLHQKYDVSSTIHHKGERGRQRENGLAMFLRETLPAAYGVATGEIIPVFGSSPSPQCDILIYDKLRMPIFGINEPVQQVPLEAVYAVIECKSVLDSKAFRDTERKFTAIKAMPRCKSKTRLKKGMQRGPLLYLFGYRLETSVEVCSEFMDKHAASSDVAVVALNKGRGFWLAGHEKSIWLNATDASANVYETLAIFFVLLLEELNSVDLGRPNLLEYFGDT